MEFYKRFLIGLGLVILLLIISFGFWHFNQGMFDNIIFPAKTKKARQVRQISNPVRLDIQIKGASHQRKINYLPENKDVEKPKLLGAVFEMPFTSQAPFGEWDNPIYQDGCEEAAVLMTMHWVRDQSLSAIEANQKLIALANWQTENYGEFRDTSTEDTARRIFKEYFGYDQVEVRKNIKLEDIINELNQGKVIIVPTDGRALNNPYYTPPGPARHNLVIYGYDKDKAEFITNDPGTRRGEGYRYKAELLFKAIQDYPTGYHLPIQKIEKNMIVVRKVGKYI